MKPTIMFFTSNSFISSLIKFFSRGNITHVAIGGFKIAGVDVCLHSDIAGIRFVTREALLKECVLVSEWQINTNDIDISNVINKLGYPYDFAAVLGFSIVEVFRWINFKIRNPFNDPHAYFCSEFIVDAFKDIPELNVDASSTTPTDLLDIVQNSKSGVFVKVN